MAGNSIGQLFRVTTCGESHGVGLMAIVDGVPPGIELSEADLQKDLDRRKPGTSKFATQRKEPDEVEIISVTSDLMKTVFDFTIGWAPGVGAKQIFMCLILPLAGITPFSYSSGIR